MKIVLRIDGKDKTFINDFVAAIHFRNALKLNKEFAENKDFSEVDPFDKIIEFAASVFEHKFSVEDVWNGLPINKIQSEPMRIFHEVLSLGGLQVAEPQIDNIEELGNESNETGK